MAVIAGGGAVVAAVAVAVIIATTLHSGSGSSGGSGADGLSASTVLAGQGTATFSASEVPSSSASEVSSSFGVGSGDTGQAIPTAFLGNWTGTLTDHTGLEGPQAAQLTLVGGGVGALVGTVNYPNVGCRYSLRLLSSGVQGVELYEVIQAGACFSEYVMLTSAGTGMTESVYASPPGGGQQPEFDGLLLKTAG